MTAAQYNTINELLYLFVFSGVIRPHLPPGKHAYVKIFFSSVLKFEPVFFFISVQMQPTRSEHISKLP